MAEDASLTIAAAPPRRTWRAEVSSLGWRKALVMVGLGIASGLPNVAVIGTLNAWLTEAGVPVATIGVLTWVGLAYAFKFLWSPALARACAPGMSGLGRRRGFMLIFQAVIAVALFVIVAADPARGLPAVAAAAVVAAFASATLDIVIDAWRIETADSGRELDVMTSLLQFGYRTASFVGGAGALLYVDLVTPAGGEPLWGNAYLLVAAIMGATAWATLCAPETALPRPAGEAARPVTFAVRAAAVGVVAAGWAGALAFVVGAVAGSDPGYQFALVLPWIVLLAAVPPAAAALALIVAGAGRPGAVERTPANGAAALVELAYARVLAPLVRLGAPSEVRVGGRTEQTARTFEGADVDVRLRNALLAPVLIGLVWAIWTLFSFMATAVSSESPPSASAFVLYTGPFVVAASILLPAAAAIMTMASRGRAWEARLPAALAPGGRLQAVADSLFGAVVAPLVELLGRLKWAALLVLAIVLTYRFTDAVWGAFAYPFYLGTEHGALGHTNTEVAVASKTFGVLMTIAGIAAGGAALMRFGRMPCLIVGGVLAAVTNLLYADLALGSAWVDGFLGATRLDSVFATFGADQRMARLMTVIAGENLAGGFASAVFVAYLSSIVSPRHAAVQFALLASLTMLLGALGRGALGEMIEIRGYVEVFVLTMWFGLFATGICALEWARRAFFEPGAAEQSQADTERV